MPCILFLRVYACQRGQASGSLRSASVKQTIWPWWLWSPRYTLDSRRLHNLYLKVCSLVLSILSCNERNTWDSIIYKEKRFILFTVLKAKKHMEFLLKIPISFPVLKWAFFSVTQWFYFQFNAIDWVGATPGKYHMLL